MVDNKKSLAEIVARLTTENFTCTLSDDTNYPNFIISYNLNSFPFVCSIPHYTIESTKTGRIFISQDSIKKVREQFNMPYDLFSSAKDRVDANKKRTEVPTPTYTLLSKTEGKRLESFYVKWFNFLSETEYTPLIKECEKTMETSSVARTLADSVLSTTKNTTESSYKKENTIRLKNSISEMVISENSNSVHITMDDWKLTKDQKLKLFMFMDELANGVK